MGGLAIVKPRDYEPGREVESSSPYSLWKELQTTAPGSSSHERPLNPGDLLEVIGEEGPGALLITKYIGFEPAQWVVPEAKNTDLVSHPSDHLKLERHDGILQG